MVVYLVCKCEAEGLAGERSVTLETLGKQKPYIRNCGQTARTNSALHHIIVSTPYTGDGSYCCFA